MSREPAERPVGRALRASGRPPGVDRPPRGDAPAPPAAAPCNDEAPPVEIGGYDGPDPTRYGDWQHKGRCTDF